MLVLIPFLHAIQPPQSSTRIASALYASPDPPIIPPNWSDIGPNQVVRPPPTSPAPRALLHFLGGAFVGAAPSITYRYLLEELARAGYVVVCTPYQLSFDYLALCERVPV